MIRASVSFILLSLLFPLSCLSAAIPEPLGSHVRLINRQSTSSPIPSPDPDTNESGFLCTGLNLTRECLVIAATDGACHDFSGSLGSVFDNSTKSLLVPAGPESACALWRTHNCFTPFIPGDTIRVFTAGDVGDNPPFDLSESGFADSAQSIMCRFVP